MSKDAGGGKSKLVEPTVDHGQQLFVLACEYDATLAHRANRRRANDANEGDEPARWAGERISPGCANDVAAHATGNFLLCLLRCCRARPTP